jgi:transcriptional regulator with XRE-family HTH domain
MLRAHLADAGISALQPPPVDGRRLHLLRAAHKATQAAMAAALGMGSAGISHVETGKNRLALHRAVLAAAFMDIPLRNLWALQSPSQA